MKKHLVQMGIAAAVVLAGLAAFGVPVARALPYALLLACPLMMMFMMRGMNHGSMNHGGSNGSGGCGHDHSGNHIGHEHTGHDQAGHEHTGHEHDGHDQLAHEPAERPGAADGRVRPEDDPRERAHH